MGKNKLVKKREWAIGAVGVRGRGLDVKPYVILTNLCNCPIKALLHLIMW